jgi:hypothetical protein
MDSIADTSPRQLARVAGGLYLINILLGAFAIGIVPAMLIVVVSLVLIPWRYVFENFVKRDSDSWGRG